MGLKEFKQNSVHWIALSLLVNELKSIDQAMKQGAGTSKELRGLLDCVLNMNFNYSL